MKLCFLLFTLGAILCLVSCTAQAPVVSTATTDFNKLVDDYFNFYFQVSPSQGTAAGFHQYDNQLEDYSSAAVDREIAGSQEFLAKFTQFPKSQLPESAAADLDFLCGQIQSELLDLQQIQAWRKDPDTYTAGVSNSIFVLMSRNFASQEDRLRSAIAREREIPKVFEAARHNLQNPPKIYLQIALQQLPDVVDFFKKDVPEAFSKVTDPKLLAEFKTANQAVIEALQHYENFLKTDLLPTANGDFRLGAENYRKKLLYQEMVDIPLDKLLEIGYADADLRRNQEQLKEVAAQIDPNRPPRAVLADLQKDHPLPISCCKISATCWVAFANTLSKTKSSPSPLKFFPSSKKPRHLIAL